METKKRSSLKQTEWQMCGLFLGISVLLSENGLFRIFGMRLWDSNVILTY
jgi:hypothetical protein